MTGYIYDTSVLSALLDDAHQRHADIARAVASLPEEASHFVSAVSLAELTFGVRMSKAFAPSRLPALEQILIDVRAYAMVHHGAGSTKPKPKAYDFLAELEASAIDVISIEAAQPGLDPAILAELPTKTIMYGVLDLSIPEVETPEVVAGRIREALRYIDAERLWIAPDCGMKYHSREHSQAKLKAMVDGAAMVRAELK